MTVLAVCRDLEAGVADAVEAALRVHAAPVVADAPVGHALVQIWRRQAEAVTTCSHGAG